MPEEVSATMTRTVSTVTDMKQRWAELIAIEGMRTLNVTTVERKATMRGIAPKREKGGNQTVEQGATNAANGVIKGTIAGNWSEMPTRGQEIGCPPEMKLENRVLLIAKYWWRTLEWMLKM